MVEKSFFSDIESALREHVSKLCEEYDIGFIQVSEWYSEVMLQISKALEETFEGSDFLPLTCKIDFEDARKAFGELHKILVISRVDKAANCLKYDVQGLLHSHCRSGSKWRGL